MAAAKIVGEEPKMSAFSGTYLVHKYFVKKQIKNMHFFFTATQYWYMRIV